jgi:hypothetical protein
MENGRRPGKLRHFGAYFGKGLRFYELKDESLGRIIFLIILLTGLLDFLVPESIYLQIILGCIRIAVMHIASTVYLTAYIMDLKGVAYKSGDCVKHVFKNIVGILFASVSFLVSVAMLIGILVAPVVALYVFSLLSIPLIILYFIFLFNVCYIVDKGKDILQSFKLSMRLTKGVKGRVFIILFTLYFLLSIPLGLITLPLLFLENSLVNSFVFIFVSSIISLVQQRVTALIYVDLEYGKDDRETINM